MLKAQEHLSMPWADALIQPFPIHHSVLLSEVLLNGLPNS